ncbi:uncharacterized protein BJ171DRAFT_585567 [Polychytrium aggregatum]|uniref:uncharacterized protein n=1 Tax=Polychytrium aggregatum TaxID=110093 RepID=UPI0022FE7508|nr:uncharacterized protein BJ171DRAFT_585567 [Polychytrium aggregatum]KAI9197451.1 hypothetical protein BJ171DRAFT_585567 [Polychytrium aggregatum]
MANSFIGTIISVGDAASTVYVLHLDECDRAHALTPKRTASDRMFRCSHCELSTPGHGTVDTSALESYPTIECRSEACGGSVQQAVAFYRLKLTVSKSARVLRLAAFECVGRLIGLHPIDFFKLAAAFPGRIDAAMEDYFIGRHCRFVVRKSQKRRLEADDSPAGGDVCIRIALLSDSSPMVVDRNMVDLIEDYRQQQQQQQQQQPM